MPSAFIVGFIVMRVLLLSRWFRDMLKKWRCLSVWKGRSMNAFKFLWHARHLSVCPIVAPSSLDAQCHGWFQVCLSAHYNVLHEVPEHEVLVHLCVWVHIQILNTVTNCIYHFVNMGISKAQKLTQHIHREVWQHGCGDWEGLMLASPSAACLCVGMERTLN